MYFYSGCRDSVHCINGDAYQKMLMWEKIIRRDDFMPGHTKIENLEAKIDTYLPHMTAVATAKAIGCSEKTIRRYARRMGYERIGAIWMKRQSSTNTTGQ